MSYMYRVHKTTLNESTEAAKFVWLHDYLLSRKKFGPGGKAAIAREDRRGDNPGHRQSHAEKFPPCDKNVLISLIFPWLGL